MINSKKIGVVLVNYHSDSDTEKTAKMFNHFECIDIIVIVNNDTNGTEKLKNLEKYSSRIKIIYKKENLGYSKGNNVGLRYLISQGCDYLIISNSDIIVDENTIVKTVECLMTDNKIGAAAPRMKDSNDRIVPLRFIKLGYIRALLRIFVSETFLDRRLEVFLKADNYYIKQSYLPGSLFCCSAEAMSECNFFDEKIFLYREEEILGQRMTNAGYDEVVLKNEYYKHDHPYHSESAKVKINRLKIVFESERYYFDKYIHTNFFQKKYIKSMQSLYMITRYMMWKLNDKRKKH